MLSINTDINSIKIRNYLSDVTDRLNNAAKRLSTGQKLNSAKDDAAGLYISSGLTPRISALTIGINAAQTGKNISDIAQGAITNMQNAFLRIRDLAVQASSDYYTTESRTAMQNEVNSLIDQITMTKEGCNFNGVNLLASTSSAATSSTSAVQQLTIDDFTNVVTTTLEEISAIWTEQEFNDWTGGGSLLTYEQYVSKCHEFLDVSIQKGEKDGQTYYFIENADQLKSAVAGSFRDDNWCELSVHSSAKFVFLSDVDLNGVEWEKYANNSTIDGNGHVVKNYSSTSSNSGLIYYNNGTIKNLGMENCSATDEYSAILCYDNEGTISNCYVIDSTASGEYSAILCRSNDGTTSDCYVTDSTVSGNGSAILCYNNYSTISDCYVTDSTASGNYSAILCYGNGSTISDCYALNITADSSMKCVYENYDSINNCYQNHNESDDTATYKDTEWFATDDAVTALGSAYELVEGKDHPTLKSNPEPAPAGSSALRIQTGFDGTTNSYLELDLGFDLGTITVDLSSATAAANSITTIDNYLTLLNDKQSIIGKDYNRLESAAQSNTLEIENMAGAKSIIVDADTAKENSEYIKTQILQNAATSLLAQTVNINSQIVLGLLTSL